MKFITTRTLMAAAALAATGLSAKAQSSVQLFTLVDANVSHYSAGSKSGAGNVTSLNDGTTNGLNGSRWGIRTTEDLGGGLKAGVLLEGGFGVDTGAPGQGGRTFGRQGYISLSSSNLGELRMGRQYIFEDSVMGMTNPFGNALTLNPGTGVTNAGKALPLWLNAPRADNVVQVQSLVYSGFQAGLQVGAGEGTADRFHGVKLGYGQGAFNTALSYEWNRARSTGDSVNKSLTVAANYNFGSFKVLGGIQRNRDLVTTSGNGAFTGSNLTVTGDVTFAMDRTTGSTVGVEVPMGQWLFGANYTTVKYANAAGTSQTLGKAAAGARYGLSKNTFLYAAASVATGDLKDYISQKSVTQVGLRAAF
ncbi:porin [Ideonella margarita]|uniref:Porin n=1 Tax=Ideonella margarita TaxID=2984191 RepID=A0ABU9C6M8_9BURK